MRTPEHAPHWALHKDRVQGSELLQPSARVITVSLRRDFPQRGSEIGARVVAGEELVLVCLAR
eukprot:2642004-Pyramimonas_sp.AAC.2